MTTPNLDATQHHWVESLAGFPFNIKYQKGRGNTVVDLLNHVTSKLNAESVKSILDGITIGTTERADAHDLMVAGADKGIHQQVKETAVQAQTAHVHVALHVMDWIALQQEDPILNIVMEWISSHKVQDLKHLLRDYTMMKEGMDILRERKKFMLHHSALSHCHIPSRELEKSQQFVVLTAHRVVAMNGFHRDTGHQGL